MVMSSLYINKQDLSINFLNNEIEKKILQKGWKKQGADFEDQKLYCYGKRNRFSILYPRKEIYTNKIDLLDL